jgi:hypothetical protein
LRCEIAAKASFSSIEVGGFHPHMNAQELDLTRHVAPIFRVKSARAKAIIDEVCTVVRTWPKLAKAAGLSRAEQEQLAAAFRIAEEAHKA